MEAPRSASHAVLSLLEESKILLSVAAGIVADLGPGSMTGVKVGVTLAKTWGFALGVHCAGITAFDLIDPTGPVVVTPRRGEHWVRHPGEDPRRLTADEIGQDQILDLIARSRTPKASNALGLKEKLDWIAPQGLVPLYLSDPLISQAKKRLTLLEPRL